MTSVVGSAVQIRRRLASARRRTSFCAQTNETLYPAAWSYGEGAGGATTSDHYDCRTQKAREHVRAELLKIIDDALDAETISDDEATRERTRVHETCDAWRGSEAGYEC